MLCPPLFIEGRWFTDCSQMECLKTPKEGKCVPVTSTTVHEQKSECRNDVSPIHDKESSWVPVINAKSKQQTKSNAAKRQSLQRPQSQLNHIGRLLSKIDLAAKIGNLRMLFSKFRILLFRSLVDLHQQIIWPKRSLSS